MIGGGSNEIWKHFKWKLQANFHSLKLYFIDTRHVSLYTTQVVHFPQPSIVKTSMIILKSRWSLICIYICWCISETSLGLPQKSSGIFSNLWKTLNIFGKCLAKFVWQVLENLWKSLVSGQKYSENCQNCYHQYVCIIKRTLNVSSMIWILCSCGENNILFVHCAHLWDIILATRTQNSFLSHRQVNPLYITG